MIAQRKKFKVKGNIKKDYFELEEKYVKELFCFC